MVAVAAEHIGRRADIERVAVGIVIGIDVHSDHPFKIGCIGTI